MINRQLHDVLRELAQKGNFSHLSIISSGKGYHATFCPAAVWGRGSSYHDTDPAQACLDAIVKAPKGPPVKEKPLTKTQIKEIYEKRFSVDELADSVEKEVSSPAPTARTVIIEKPAVLESDKMSGQTNKPEKKSRFSLMELFSKKD